jgi:TRAP-type C4-dicarboxylate transport system substrate-binding protein
MLARYISDRKLGFTLLATGGGGARSFLNMQGPIVVPADMEGLKLRTVVNAMTKKIWALVDAIPMAVSATEAYSAVQTGVCNSIEASLSFFNSSRLTELAKYLSLSRHEFLVTHVSIRDLTFAKLPKEHQDAVKQAAMEAGDLVTKLGIEIDAEMVDYLIKKDDLKVNEIDRAAFIDLFTPLQHELAEDLPGTDKGLELLEAIRTLKD